MVHAQAHHRNYEGTLFLSTDSLGFPFLKQPQAALDSHIIQKMLTACASPSLRIHLFPEIFIGNRDVTSIPGDIMTYTIDKSLSLGK